MQFFEHSNKELETNKVYITNKSCSEIKNQKVTEYMLIRQLYNAIIVNTYGRIRFKRTKLDKLNRFNAQ